MKQGLLLWSPSHHSFLSPSLPLTFSSISRAKSASAPIKAAVDPIDSQQELQLTARERRKLRNERREDKAGYSWKEEVQEKLSNMPKKKPLSTSEEINLDTLSRLGPQWWMVYVNRGTEEYIAEVLGRVFSKSFPTIDCKTYVPTVEERRKLKNGLYSIKTKLLYPKRVFLWCQLNGQIVDVIRELAAVRYFHGQRVGYVNQKITRPLPISEWDMKAIFQQEEQLKQQEQQKQQELIEQLKQKRYDQDLEEEQQGGKIDSVNSESEDVTDSVPYSKPKGRSRKGGALANGSSRTKTSKLTAGSTVRVISGDFAEFTGSLKKLTRKTGKATVGFTLFGKETLVDLDVNEIVAV